MAQAITLEGLKKQMILSIHGRKLGISYGNSSDVQAAGAPEFLVGVAGLRTPTTVVTTASTAADQIPAYGVTIFQTTGASTSGTTYHSIQNPIPGLSAMVVNGSTLAMTLWLNGSTGTTSVLGWGQPSGAATSGLTTATAVNLPKLGTYVCLTALTTGVWLMESAFGTTVTTWATSAT